MHFIFSFFSVPKRQKNVNAEDNLSEYLAQSLRLSELSPTKQNLDVNEQYVGSANTLAAIASQKCYSNRNRRSLAENAVCPLQVFAPFFRNTIEDSLASANEYYLKKYQNLFVSNHNPMDLFSMSAEKPFMLFDYLKAYGGKCFKIT